jgi:hypothetical protein
MDLFVWSSRPFDLPNQLPEPKLWTRYQHEWAFEAKGWHVLVLPTLRSDKDAPDPAVLQKLPDASHVAHVTLEPIGADRAGYAFLEKVVRGLALATDGVWVDPFGQAFMMRVGLNRARKVSGARMPAT